MRGIGFSILLLSLNAILVLCEFKCPQTEDISPCTCDEKLGSIACIGSPIADHELGLIGQNIRSGAEVRFTSLTIQNTAITSMDRNTYIDANFDEIIIENNTQLVSVKNETFKKGFVKSLIIRNNPKLNDSIFSLLTYLKPSDIIRFNGNAIKQIPYEAFNSDAKQVFLDNNKIESIGSNAFSSLPYLTRLSIDHNFIDNIDKNGLMFSIYNYRQIIVSLNDNKLTSKSFTINSLPKHQNIAISLHLENNHLIELPEDVFRSFIEENEHKMYLSGNIFNCDCNMKWVVERPQSNHIYSVFCDDKQKSIFNLKSEEFLCHETEPPITTTKFIETTKDTEPAIATKSTDRKEPTRENTEPFVPTLYTRRQEPTTKIEATEPAIVNKESDRPEPEPTRARAARAAILPL